MNENAPQAEAFGKTKLFHSVHPFFRLQLTLCTRMGMLLGEDLDHFHLSDVSLSATHSINHFPLDTAGGGRLETDVFSQFPGCVVSALLLC